MGHLKARLFGVVLIMFFAGMTYYNWRQLNSEGSYSLKMAAFGPVGVVGGFFLLLFPAKGGRPETTRDKIIVLLVFGIGLAAGLLNWYLMDPGFFGR
jgi:NhaP-type Na+/H+ or K+/H+ antiporter